MDKERIEYYSLRVFFFCLFVTAGLFLYALWFITDPVETYFKTVATFFVVGLASFLVWFTTAMLQLRSRVEKEQ